MYSMFFAILERERERIEEKKQRMASEKKTTQSQADKVPSEDSTTAASAPAAVGTAVEPAKELKIEVHATAVHHEKLEPIVAHAQSHEISHNQAVNQLKSVSLCHPSRPRPHGAGEGSRSTQMS